jgi:RNA polymerase sigma-70 factor, ECF subfamily
MQTQEFFPFDGDYVRRLAAGDSETERHFVGYFSSLLLIKLRRRLRMREDVEDLRQEVFLRVLRSLRQGQVERPECLGAYVSAVGNHVICEYLRTKAKAIQWDENAPEPRDPGTGIERELVSEESRRLVRNLIDEMPPKDRNLMRAVFLEERDKDTVCSEQGVGRDYLRVLLHRAKKRFRQLLTESQKPGAHS